MKTKVGMSFGTALLLAIGVVATMLALGMFSSSQVKAAAPSTTTLQTVTSGGSINAPITPGALATYSMAVQPTAQLTAGSGTLYIKFDSAISVPSSIEKERITISASGGGTSNPLFDPTITTNEDGDTVVLITIGDTDPNTTGTQNLAAWDTSSTNRGHTLVFSALAGITNSTSPSTTKAWVQASEDGVTYGSKVYIPVYRYLSLSSGSGARGKTLTLTGKGWKSGTATVFLDLDGDRLLDTTDTVIGTSDAAISGGAFTATITADTNFSIGNNSINAVDGVGTTANQPGAGARYVSQGFTLRGSVSIDPTSASRGESVKITLSDYGNGTVTAITFGGVPADLSGLSGLTVTNNTSSITVTVPSTTPLGTQTVNVSSSGESDRDTSITVGGLTMSVSPSTAVANQAITVSGSGFTASGTIASQGLTVGGTRRDTLTNGNAITTVTADNSGNMVLSFKVPNNDTTRTAGTHVVKIVDSSNRIGEVNLTIPARTITLDTAESRRGSTVNFTGSGFVASTTVTVTFLSGTTTTTVATVTADSSGNISGSFQVPTSAGIPSTNTVTATSSCSTGTTDGTTDNCTQTSATASHKVPGATVTVDPTSAASGETITVNGVDFPGFVSLSALTIGTVSALPTPAPATDSAGTFSLTALVPQLATGSHSMVVTVGSGSSAVTATTSFSVVEAAAEVPAASEDTTETVFADEIAADNLVRVWFFDNATQTWSFYDPRPAFEAANTYTTATGGNIVWVNVTEETTFQGSTLYAGWNLISLD